MYNKKTQMLNVNFNNQMQYSSNTKFNKTYWDEQRALGTISRAEEHENAKHNWDRITKDSLIRKIEIEIAGSGDDGSIEEVHFFDENDELIEPRYELGSLEIPTKTYYDSDAEDATKIIKPFVNYWETDTNLFKTREEALNCLMEYYNENNILDATPHYEDGIIIRTDYELIRDNNNNQKWEHWGDIADRQCSLEFPLIKNSLWFSDRTNKHPLRQLYGYTYSLLPGGWEINEGSTSRVTFYNDQALENGINNSSFKIKVNHTQYDYTEHNDAWEINSEDDMFKMVKKFIDDNKIKNHTINLKNKRHNELFYQLTKRIGKSMYNENIEVE